MKYYQYHPFDSIILYYLETLSYEFRVNCDRRAIAANRIFLEAGTRRIYVRQYYNILNVSTDMMKSFDLQVIGKHKWTFGEIIGGGLVLSSPPPMQVYYIISLFVILYKYTCRRDKNSVLSLLKLRFVVSEKWS